MDANTRTRIEYEHQFFGFSSDALVESYRELLTETICDKGLKSTAKMIRKKLGPYAQDPEALDKGLDEMVEELKGKYEIAIDSAFKKYEDKIKECFRIPDNLLLPEDQVVSTVAGLEEDELDKEIAKLQNELKNMAVLMEETTNEQNMADQVLAVLKEADKLEPPAIPDLSEQPLHSALNSNSLADNYE